jgi:hypothetical protein
MGLVDYAHSCREMSLSPLVVQYSSDHLLARDEESLERKATYRLTERHHIHIL